MDSGPNFTQWSHGDGMKSLVNVLFSLEQAKAILNIPLSSIHREDSLCWFPNTKGCFSVESTYKVAWDQNIEGKFSIEVYGYDKLNDFRRHKRYGK